MIDERRLRSDEILALMRSGAMDNAPKTMVPDGAKMVDASSWEEKLDLWDDDAVRAALEDGGVMAYMEYGIWHIWKTDQGFSGQLMQYARRTDSFVDQPIEYAMVKVSGWRNLDE